MAENSKIEWTDATWNVVTGCSVYSSGCRNCYAMKLAGTRLQHHPSRAGLTRPSAAGPVWTGEVRFNEQWLDQPQRWCRPRDIFVCAHSDLFHEALPDEVIDQVFAVMANTPWHRFQVLTKRARRMREYLTARQRRGAIEDAELHLVGADKIRVLDDPQPWPLPNVLLMVSAERQQEFDERVPELLGCPAALTGVSLEPLLGPIQIDRRLIEPITGGAQHGRRLLDWVICGGESGPGARPMHPDWARSLRDQCAAAGVPFLFKQWGGWLPGSQAREVGNQIARVGACERGWKWDNGTHSWHIGKKAAGRLLDGVTHDGFPS